MEDNTIDHIINCSLLFVQHVSYKMTQELSGIFLRMRRENAAIRQPPAGWTHFIRFYTALNAKRDAGWVFIPLFTEGDRARLSDFSLLERTSAERGIPAECVSI